MHSNTFMAYCFEIACFLEGGGDCSSCVFLELKIENRDCIPLFVCVSFLTWRVKKKRINTALRDSDIFRVSSINLTSTTTHHSTLWFPFCLLLVELTIVLINYITTTALIRSSPLILYLPHHHHFACHHNLPNHTSVQHRAILLPFSKPQATLPKAWQHLPLTQTSATYKYPHTPIHQTYLLPISHPSVHSTRHLETFICHLSFIKDVSFPPLTQLPTRISPIIHHVHPTSQLHASPHLPPKPATQTSQKRACVRYVDASGFNHSRKPA